MYILTPQKVLLSEKLINIFLESYFTVWAFLLLKATLQIKFVNKNDTSCFEIGFVTCQNLGSIAIRVNIIRYYGALW